MAYEFVVVGASLGGLEAVSILLAQLSPSFSLPIAVAQHRAAEPADGDLAALWQRSTALPVADVEDKAPIEVGHVYVAPADYHLLVESRDCFALSTDPPVLFARPSIDVLFESVADEYGRTAVGVVLTGANADGAAGLARIKERGGVAIVQEPTTSTRRRMPDAAIAATTADAILPLEEIPAFLYGLCA
jgi:two-component system, chemotaxis family, protein-glutamate methylesterase/glutaminase